MNLITANNIRQQLTLFVPTNKSQQIEKCRSTFNWERYKLIKSHITLCRDEELEELAKIKENLKNLAFNPIVLALGKPVRFAAGKGVLLPIISGHTALHNLRIAILNGVIANPKKHEPHITLLHPRNATCTNEIYTEILNIDFPEEIVFTNVSLIEQLNGGPWKILETY
jgi:2'-5' RNA ligase